MSLLPGTRLGAFEIVGLIGAGGMGEVYRAHDARLQRDVAIKVLPDAFASDADRVARFTREAQVLASLNHPHIGAIYGVEDRALVLELVEGPTLADRIARGPLPLDEALAIARQICDALEAAHEHGIIHRDLKPANIKLTRDGNVKVLDFGLAKASTASETVTADLDNSPTLTSAGTHMGIILGTAAYMSPEQARGKPVDKRTDIWAFGCVLFEMLSGKRAFEGSNVHDVLVAILSTEPRWDALRPAVPASIRNLLRRCLQNDRRRRLADIADARIEIEDETNRSGVRGAHVITNDARPTRLREYGLPWAVAAAAILSAGALAVWPLTRTTPAPSTLVRVNGELGAPVSLVTAQGAGAILSPDGSTLAFVGQPSAGGGAPQIYLRGLEQLSAQPLAGTEGAMNPFFSPDGRWIGFFSGGKLRKASVSGGGSIAIADAPNGRGGSWGDDDHLVFMADFYAGLSRVPAAGGASVTLTTPPPGGTDRWPHVLPGSKAVMFTRHTSLTGYEKADIVLQPLPTGEPRVVHRGGFYGRYLSSGHVTFVQGGTLFAAAFDLDRLERTGEPAPVMQDVANGGFWTGAAQFDVSHSGTAVYASGSNAAMPIQWLDTSGQVSLLRSTASNWADPSFSADGAHLAMDIWDGKQSDIWIHDVARGSTSRLTVDPADDFKPVWTPDGTRVAYTSSREGSFGAFWQRVDGTGDVQRMPAPGPSVPTSWHPTGKFLALNTLSPQTSFDLVVLPVEGDEASGWKPGTPRTLLNGPAVEIEGMFSPDGRWLAYVSNESGRFEIYVRPFPGSGGPWQVSNGGGTLPTWSRARNELFYGTLDQRIMVAAYTTAGGSFRPEPPRAWSEARYEMLGPVINRHFDLHPDGKRIGLAKLPDAGMSRADKVVFAFNFFDEVRKVVPKSK